jgi:hypothetical protein
MTYDKSKGYQIGPVSGLCNEFTMKNARLCGARAGVSIYFFGLF